MYGDMSIPMREILVNAPKISKHIENGEIKKTPKYLTDLWTEHAVKFIEENRERPFCYMVSLPDPHGPKVSLD